VNGSGVWPLARIGTSSSAGHDSWIFHEASARGSLLPKIHILKKKLLHKYYNVDDVVVSGGGRSILLIFARVLVAALCTQ
jgi:hypothetical protein